MVGSHKAFAPKHWVTLVTFAALIALGFGIRWIVRTQRSPGAITVIEAQGMDMAAMKAPIGVQPVAAEKVSSRTIANEQGFPATVMAYSDEEIVARVPGKVLTLAYPGDNVMAGQVVARIDAAEYTAQQRQSEDAAMAGSAQATASEREVDLLRDAKAHGEAEVQVATAAISKAVADQTVAVQEQQKSRAEAAARWARVKARQAELVYAEQSLGRQESLYRQGFASLDQYQMAQRARDKAKADLDDEQAEATAMDSAAQAASDRISAADKEIEEARDQTRSSQIAVSEAQHDLERAQAMASATKAQARAASSQSESASIIADYTQLRSLDDCMVAERFVSPGSVVTAGQKLLMLHVADRVRIQAQLPERLVASVMVGRPVTIHYAELTKSARITSVFPTADTSTRTFTAEALVPNPGHRFLPGSFASMSVQTSDPRTALAVRSSAIQTDASGNRFVWVVSQSAEGQKADWTCPMHTEISEPGPGKCPICKMELVPRVRGGKTVASRRRVKTGPSDGSVTGIESGLHPDDLVIWAGFETLIEGSPVNVVPWSARGPERTQAVGIAPAAPPPPMESPSGAKRVPVQGTTAHKQLYTCPMHPEVVQDHPGRCPKCGMELVP